MTRREQALRKIRKLDRRLEITKTQNAIDRIEREICRLQLVYGITLEEIKGPKDYKKMFPFLSDQVVDEMKKLTGGK